MAAATSTPPLRSPESNVITMNCTDPACGCAPSSPATGGVSVSALKSALSTAPDLPLTVIWTDGEPIEAILEAAEVPLSSVQTTAATPTEQPAYSEEEERRMIERLRDLEARGMTYAITYFVEQAYDLSGVELFEREVLPARADDPAMRKLRAKFGGNGRELKGGLS